MKLIARTALLAAAAAMTMAPTKPAPRTAPRAAAAGPAGNWMATVVRTPGNSIVVGNPNAKLKLAEYFSYTCPHCAHFEIEGGAPLSLGFIKPGVGSMEYRPYMRNAIDVAATLMAFCGTPAKFPGNHAALLHQQSKWFTQVSEAQAKRWETGLFATRMRAIASDMHLYDLFTARGYDRPSLDRCLANEALAKAWIDENQKATDVEGTPTFYLNGQKQYVNTWDGLRPVLMDATR